MIELWDVVNEALITLLVALIGLLSWYLRLWLQQRLSADQLQIVNVAASMAVQAAEQLGGDAEEKKRAALGIAGDWLEARNIRVDIHALDSAIEAAVFAEIGRFKLEPVIELSSFEPGADGAKPEAAE